MKALLQRFFLFLVLSSACLPAQAQQMYTRKARLADFPTRTLKVVAGGNSFLELSLKEEISSRWRVSPFEFCTVGEYESLKEDNGYYFLHLGTEEGIAFLILSKGGKEDESDNFRKPFEVVRLPIASLGDPSGRELMYMGAFIDIIQAFVEEAMISDRTAYTGLKSYNQRTLSGRTVHVDPDGADAAFHEGTPGAVAGIVIAPTNISFDSFCYKMLIAADTHELLYFRKAKYKGSKDAAFTKSEIRQFRQRNGIIAQ